MPITPYTTNIPLATQAINQTQQAINDNFTCLVNNITPANGLITVNHVGTNDPTDYGKHKFVQFPVQIAAPTTAANELALYTKTISAITHLFLRQPSNGIEIDLSSALSATASNVTTTTFNVLNGLIIKVGFTSGNFINPDTLGTITFPVQFPNNCISVIPAMLIPTATSSSNAPPNTAILVDYSATQFRVFNRKSTGNSAIGLTFIAIGN